MENLIGQISEWSSYSNPKKFYEIGSRSNVRVVNLELGEGSKLPKMCGFIHEINLYYPEKPYHRQVSRPG